MGEIIRGIVVILLTLGGAYSIWKLLAKSGRCTEQAEVPILKVERRIQRHSRRRQVRYYPVVQFTVNGVEYEAAADISSILPNKYKPGETLQIRYNAEDPGEFLVKGKSLRSSLFLGILMLVLGLSGIAVFFLK